MKDSMKSKGLGLATLVVGGLAVWLLTRKEEEDTSDLSLVLYDSEGRRVAGLGNRSIGALGPASIDEGGLYYLDITITNRSTKGGLAIGVGFDVYTVVTVAGTTLVDDKTTEAFTPSQTRTIRKPLTIPVGTTGAGTAVVTLRPGSTTISSPIVRSVTLSFTVGALPIVYDADLVLS